MKIPKQYEENEIKFCKVKKGTKNPFEKDWVNKPYSLKEIKPWIESGENYGILCGYNGLIIVDSDEKELRDHIDKWLPKTFRVKTGGGGYHDYFFCKDIKKKIILDTGKHFGEILSFKNAAIGAGSKHPNGDYYEVVRDMDIVEIGKEELLSTLKPFIKDITKSQQKAISELKNYGESDINSIAINKVIDISKFRFNDKEYQGSNPWHGSSTGMNFTVNTKKNVGYCFRCNVGINVATAIALNEGIIKNCYDLLSKSEFLKVLDIATEKYGLKRINKKDYRKLFFDKIKIAEEFIKHQPLHYDESGMWWIWDNKNTCWKLKDEVDVLNLLYEETEYDTISSSSKTEILNALKQVGRKNKPQDVPKSYIQFKNKIVDLNTGEIFNADYKYFITNPIPWELGEDTKTPMMDRLFEEWVGLEKIDTLYEIIAYCLLPDYPIHRLFCFYGSGMNGKSCYLRLLKKFIGDENCASSELDLLLSSRFEKAKLYKKLVCLMGETDFNELTGTSIIKQLTGQDLIGFEFKNKTPFQDVNYAKILISTNNLPMTNDKTIGFYRRWTIIDFPNQFSEKMEVLDYIPESEYNNLAKKSIGVLRDLLKKREFWNEGSVEERMKNFEDKSNPFEKFWVENIDDKDADAHIFKFDFKQKFDEWCKEHHFRQMSERTIGKNMKDKQIETGRINADWHTSEQKNEQKRYRAWIGIKWKE